MNKGRVLLWRCDSCGREVELQARAVGTYAYRRRLLPHPHTAGSVSAWQAGHEAANAGASA
jgi:hypothetical protein